LETPVVSCQRSTSNSKDVRNKTLTCDEYTITTTASVTYAIQRRNNAFGGNCVTTGTRVNIGNFPGIRTRTVKISPTLFSATTVVGVSGSGGSHATRTISNPSGTSAGLVEVTDRWRPNNLVSPLFDNVSPNSYPSKFPGGMTTGYGLTSATTNVEFTKIRLYPDAPTWYAQNKWNEFVVASFSPDIRPAANNATCGANCLTAGTRGGIELVVISTGKPLAGQNRYSVTLPLPAAADFLEAPNATGGTTRVYSSTTQPHSTTYVDTVVTIPR
jgi:hypothetical protein